MATPCCERDSDRDGNCDRHPSAQGKLWLRQVRATDRPAPGEDRYCPEPDDDACEWPERACPTSELPCNRCPYHREQY